MDSRIIALCGYLAVLCFFSNAQSTKQKKDVLIFEDTCFIKSDTIKELKSIANAAQEADSCDVVDSLKLIVPTSSPEDSSIIVTRGYSPFTNYTDTFNITQTTPPKVSQEILIPQKKKTERIYTPADTINNQFIHEYNLSYTKTELTASWNQYMNESVRQEPKGTIEISVDEAQQIAIEAPVKQTQDMNNAELATNNNPTTNSTLASHSVNKSDKNLTINTDNSFDIEYFIQLAASRKALNPNEIKKLTAKNEQVRTIEEEQWFKYQIPIGTDYLKARATINNYPSKNVFLVAYRGMHRLDLWETVKHIELQKPKNELIFVIQLAASRTPLTREQISQLHDGHEHVREIDEEGWHKYQIAIGSSYNLTIEKWKMIGVNKSFPVAYLNNQKIEMSEALKLTRINK